MKVSLPASTPLVSLVSICFNIPSLLCVCTYIHSCSYNIVLPTSCLHSGGTLPAISQPVVQNLMISLLHPERQHTSSTLKQHNTQFVKLLNYKRYSVVPEQCMLDTQVRLFPKLLLLRGAVCVRVCVSLCACVFVYLIISRLNVPHLHFLCLCDAVLIIA